MTFKQLLRDKLSIKNIDLPSGYQRIGNIIIINLPESSLKFKNQIGETILNLFPDVRTVCNKTGPIHGEFRQPQIEVIAGDNNTSTTHSESGCKYTFDIKKIMFAKGNVSERVRIPKQVKQGEVIVDMFAGIGYFSIPIGKLSKPKIIYSIELNPDSFHFLLENIKINKINSINPINKDNREAIKELVQLNIKADRVIMGYLPPPKDFLPSAFSIIKQNGIIHYEDLVNTYSKDVEFQRVMNTINQEAEKYKLKTNLIVAKKIKSYGPKIDHYVFDVQILS